MKELEKYEVYNPETGEYDMYTELPKKVLLEVIRRLKGNKK